jgi:hypothetical protein
MITLLEKYRHYEAIIKKREDDYVYATIKDVPNAVYQIAGRFVISELKVDDVKYCSHKYFWFDKRPTRKLVEEIKSFAESEYQFQLENILIQYTQSGTFSSRGSFKYIDLHKYLTKEMAEEISLAEKAVFDAEEELIKSGTHFRCERCRKATDKNQMIRDTIIGRGRDHFGRACLTREPMSFCSGQCASHEQMSREG